MGVAYKTLMTVSIMLNAVSAGGIFCFPMFSPSLASHLHLSQRQLSTIALAGMSGQYPFAVIAGMLIDRVGPWACSAAASIFFYVGFGLFSMSLPREERPHEMSISTPQYILLVLYYFFAGLGTLTGYFSSLFAASKIYPTRTGLATGVVNSLFGLSPLFLSTLGTLFFPDPIDGLDAPSYILFLAIFSGTISLVGSIVLRGVPKRGTDPASNAGEEVQEGVLQDPTVQPEAVPRNVRDGEEDTETAPLLARSMEVYPPREHSSVLELVKDPDFLLMGLIMLCITGMCEMIISNIGTIVASFSPPSPSSPSSFFTFSSGSAASQVQLLSLSNTLSRLITGPIADFVSPIPIAHPQPTRIGERTYGSGRRMMTRVAFVQISAVLLLAGVGWMTLGVSSAGGVWFVSLMAGAAYGMIWTVTPSIVESIWGPSHAARNFGTLSYAPFLGVFIFSLLYASLADLARDNGSEDPICRGSSCWRGTFAIGSVVLVCVSAGSVFFRRRVRKLV